MKQRISIASNRDATHGMTLIELVITCAILSLMATVALPVARMTIIRNREADLRYDLRQIRDAIDRYNFLASNNLVQAEAGSGGYPPDLETLVKGTVLGVADQKMRFLRRIPVDPMTGKRDWDLRCMQDDEDSTGWCGQNVFDVHSKSHATALDGTKYSDW